MITDGILTDDAGWRLLWFHWGIIFEKSLNVCVHVNPWWSADARPQFHTWSDCVSVLVGSFFEIFHASQTRRARGIWAFFRGEISCREYIWHLFCSPFCLGDKWQNILTFFLPGIYHLRWHLPTVDRDFCRYLWHIAPALSHWQMSTTEKCINCSLLSNIGYFFLSPCPCLLVNCILVKNPWFIRGLVKACVKLDKIS